MSRSLSTATTQDFGVGSIEDRPNTGTLQPVGSRTFGRLSSFDWISRSQVSAAAVSFLDSLTTNSVSTRSILDRQTASQIATAAQANMNPFGVFDPIPVSQGNAVILIGNYRALVISSTGIASRSTSATNTFYNQCYVNPANANQLVAMGGGSGSSFLTYATSNDGGNTWTEATVSATLFSSSSLSRFGIDSSALQSIDFFNNSIGEIYVGNAADACWQLRCASRVITWGVNSGGTALRASASTTGYGSDVNTDATSTILGSTTLGASNQYVWMKSSGNNAFIAAGNGNFNGTTSATARFSTDGGVTWATSTSLPSIALGQSTRFVNNSSDASRFFVCGNATTTFVTTVNFGGLFAQRTLPFQLDTGNDTIAWAGSVAVLVDNSASTAYITTNDFVTVTMLTAPSGVTGLPTSTFSVGNRVFIVYGSGQVAVTSDGVNFSVRSVKNFSNQTFSRAAIQGTRIVALRSTSSSQSIVMFSSDDGVTWECAGVCALSGANSFVGALIRNIDVGTGYFVFTSRGSNANNLGTTNAEQLVPANFTGPQSFALTSTTINPIRTGATAYMRIE